SYVQKKIESNFKEILQNSNFGTIWPSSNAPTAVFDSAVSIPDSSKPISNLLAANTTSQKKLADDEMQKVESQIKKINTGDINIIVNLGLTSKDKLETITSEKVSPSFDTLRAVAPGEELVLSPTFPISQESSIQSSGSEIQTLPI